MDQQAAKRLIEDTFSQPFDDARFRVFIRNLVNNIDETKAFEYHGQYIPDSFKQHITQYKRVGKYVDPAGNSLDVLIVHLRKESALERARTKQRNFVGWYLNGGRGDILRDAALAAFVAPGEEDWRFSLVRMEYKQEMTDTGRIKVREELTPARRYSFLVGKNEPNHTAQQQIVPILQDDRHNPAISELEQAFSVEAVTKQFYLDYRGLFESARDALQKLVGSDSRVQKEFEAKLIDPANFAKKLLGQIVFLYFLQKKGWLGVGKDDQGNLKPWGTGPKNFLQRLFNREFVDYGNFFNDVLEPLFYDALATEHDYDYYPHLQCKIPFLNGASLKRSTITTGGRSTFLCRTTCFNRSSIHLTSTTSPCVRTSHWRRKLPLIPRCWGRYSRTSCRRTCARGKEPTTRPARSSTTCARRA